MYTIEATYCGENTSYKGEMKQYREAEQGVAWKAYKDAVMGSAEMLRNAIKVNGMDRMLGGECEYVVVEFRADELSVARFRRYRDGMFMFEPFTEEGLEFQREMEGGGDLTYLRDKVFGDVMSRYELHFTLHNEVAGDGRDSIDCCWYFPSVKAAEECADRLLMKVRDYDEYRRVFEIRDTVEGTVPMKLYCQPDEINPASCAYDSNIKIDGNIPAHNSTIEKLRKQAWEVCCNLRGAKGLESSCYTLEVAEQYVACLRIVQHRFEDFGTEDIIVGGLIDAVKAVIDWVREHE